MHIDELKYVLKEETALMKQYALLQESVREIVEKQSWSELEQPMIYLESLSKQIEALDQQRDALFRTVRSDVGSGKHDPFIQVITRFPVKEQKEMMNLYLMFRVEVVRLKAGSERFRYYIKALSDTVGQVLSEFFPHRKGRLYARSGRTSAVGDESVMINKEL